MSVDLQFRETIAIVANRPLHTLFPAMGSLERATEKEKKGRHMAEDEVRDSGKLS